jgi:hypothetical protein
LYTRKSVINGHRETTEGCAYFLWITVLFDIEDGNIATTYKILSNILLSRLIPYAEEVIGGSSMWIPTQQVDY